VGIIRTHKKTLKLIRKIKITEMWITQTLKHITQYIENCRKWTPVSSTHTLPPSVKRQCRVEVNERADSEAKAIDQRR
jgi:hypothetical protein